MEIDEEYIDKVKSFIEQKDAENVKALLIDLHPADIAELCNDSRPKRHASFTVSSTTKQPPTYW